MIVLAATSFPCPAVATMQRIRVTIVGIWRPPPPRSVYPAARWLVVVTWVLLIVFLLHRFMLGCHVDRWLRHHAGTSLAKVAVMVGRWY